MVCPVLGSVKTGRPVSQHRFVDIAADGDGLLTICAVGLAIGADSGLAGTVVFNICKLELECQISNQYNIFVYKK